jgi:two-component system sensor histidine kinase DesK
MTTEPRTPQHLVTEPDVPAQSIEPIERGEPTSPNGPAGPDERVQRAIDRGRVFGIRLLPADSQLGWTPYAWLVYLVVFFIDPAYRLYHDTLTPGYTAVTTLAATLFIASYFRSFWVHGLELTGIVVFQAALAVVFTPVNPGASVFFIYAGASAGRLKRHRGAAVAIVAVAATGLATSWLTGQPAFVWINAIGFPLLIGFVSLHQERIRRANARLRVAQEQIEQLATVAERERIARDLHDVLGHTLSLIVLKSELASKLASRDPERAAREIRDVEQVARKALAEVRETVRGYRASLTTELDQSRAILAAAGVLAEIDAQPIRLGRDAEEALALALREAVTNVVRHAHASVCRIRLRTHATGAATLIVEDDGRATRATLAAPEGHGLRGMRERIEARSGTVTRSLAHQGHGLRLELRLPAATGLASGTGSVLLALAFTLALAVQ